MAPVVYTAVERFDPETHANWAKFVAWSRLPQLREVVSMDSSLCPNWFRVLLAEDWKHNVHANCRTSFFHNVEHVCARVAGERVNVLAVLEEPSTADLASFGDPRFEFCGFDLIEERTDISALSNCGGFDEVFLPGELSELGLLVDHARAVAVQERLPIEYPDEPHACCRMWAIWRMRR